MSVFNIKYQQVFGVLRQSIHHPDIQRVSNRILIILQSTEANDRTLTAQAHRTLTAV